MLGVPLALLADRGGKTRVIAGSLVVWSGFTALCGTAAGFWQLFLYRLGVGVGEAGGVAPSYALIADYFPVERRARALAIYSMGIPIGLGGGRAARRVYRHARQLAGGVHRRSGVAGHRWSRRSSCALVRDRYPPTVAVKGAPSPLAVMPILARKPRLLAAVVRRGVQLDGGLWPRACGRPRSSPSSSAGPLPTS